MVSLLHHICSAHIRQILEQHSLVKSPCVWRERRVCVVGRRVCVVGRRGECVWWGGGKSVGVGVVEWRESVCGGEEGECVLWGGGKSVCGGEEGRVCVVERRGKCECVCVVGRREECGDVSAYVWHKKTCCYMYMTHYTHTLTPTHTLPHPRTLHAHPHPPHTHTTSPPHITSC